VSIGVALAPDHGLDADTLIRNADFALYKVKAQGKNSYRLFDADLEIEANARRELEADLRQALVLEQFELHYQPVVALSGGRIVGAEALLRWRHPTRGFVSPDTLIPIAEETGLIVPIGEWVIRQACREAALWPDDIRLAVNISTAQLGRSNLVEVVTQALAQSGLPANRVEIEVTETIFLRNDEALLADLHQLHALGVRLALDDFGTGYSSLGYLRKLPFGKIKIDRSFISDLGHDVQSAAVVCAVANLASSLFIETTAEGVETEDQARLVATAGCTHGQGYLFGRPMPNASLIDMLSNRQGRKVA
jgi:predicted signal transduction protein with EAL and GGDEF domain